MRIKVDGVLILFLSSLIQRKYISNAFSLQMLSLNPLFIESYSKCMKILRIKKGYFTS